MKKTNIGLTGSSGILGKILVNKLNKIGASYSCFDADIRSKYDVKKWINDNNFTDIIHFAAMVPTKDVNENPLEAYEVNATGTINLIKEIKELQKDIWFFYASSCHIYKSSEKPIDEEHPIEPISLYGKTKQVGDSICQDLMKLENHNLKICCGRIFSFYHETQSKPFLYPTLLERLQNEDLSQPFFIYGADGVRDFLNAEEVIDIIVKLMTYKALGTYNIGSGKGIKIRDFVQSMTDYDLKIKTNDISNILVANIDKLKNFLKHHEK